MLIPLNKTFINSVAIYPNICELMCKADEKIKGQTSSLLFVDTHFDYEMVFLPKQKKCYEFIILT